MSWVSMNGLLSMPFVIGWIGLPLWMVLKHPWWLPSRRFPRVARNGRR